MSFLAEIARSVGPTVRSHDDWSWHGLRGSSGALFSPCERYRYALWRDWDRARVDLGIPTPTLLFVGLNPSVADERIEDHTLRLILKLAARLGCASLVMLNVFGLRSTDPKELRSVVDPVGQDNDTAIRRFTAKLTGHLVFGWGANPMAVGRGAHVVSDVVAPGWCVRCLGVTKGGQPRHPLYLADATPLVPWRLAMASMTAPARICARGRFHVGQAVSASYFGRGRVKFFKVDTDGMVVRWDKTGLETLMSPHLLTPIEEKPA